MADDTVVGYGKAPRKSQFTKGKSGNPQGRPKGSISPSTVLIKALREKVIIQENGKRKVITKLQAIMKQTVNRAASGDAKGLQHLLHLLRLFEDQITKQFEGSLAPAEVHVHFVESDGNGRPKVIPGCFETDENGNVTGDLDEYRRNRP
jgi:hypothetical protein